MNNFVVSTRKKELVCPEESLSSPVTTSTNVGKDFEPDKNLQPYIYSKIQGELNKSVVEGDINTHPLKMLSLEQKWSSVTDEETVNVFTLEKMDALEEFVLKIHTMKVKGQISDCLGPPEQGSCHCHCHHCYKTFHRGGDFHCHHHFPKALHNHG